MNSTEFTENLFGAVDTIVQARMQDLSYDTTVICTITNDSLKRQRRYTVSDGSVEFEAYAQEKTLSKGEQVLVTIPNGDYSMRKVIIDKVDNEIINTSTYTTPLS